MPFHGNLSRGMAGGTREDLELQETPRLLLLHSYEDVWRPWAQEIRARLTRQMHLWEKGLHTGLLGDAKAEGAAREGRSASGVEEWDEVVAWSYYNTVLSDKLCQAVRLATNREGGGCLLLDDQCTKTGRPVAEVLWEKHPDMRSPLMENPT